MPKNPLDEEAAGRKLEASITAALEAVENLTQADWHLLTDLYANNRRVYDAIVKLSHLTDGQKRVLGALLSATATSEGKTTGVDVQSRLRLAGLLPGEGS